MKCPKCDFDNPADSSFCSKCGTRITLPSETAPSPTATLQVAARELPAGTTFAGRYLIYEELGRGGMGRVYKALDKEVEEKVALKLLNPEIAADSRTIERFRNELKNARHISHKNVCRMYHFGNDEGAYYITMEYVRGEDLKSVIRMMGRLSPGQAVSIARQISEGLAEAHRLGVIHRDLKPQNIMIDHDGTVKIMDFGIARSVRSKGITGPGVMIGTPEYMAPEQVEGKETDERSDIYALGIILYEMLTGRVPFEGETPLSVAYKQTTEIPEDPRKFNPQIPDDLRRLILRCLSKEKEKRYQRAGELVAEFDRLEKSLPAAERVLPRREAPTSKELTVRLTKRWRAVAGVAVVGVVILAAVFFLGRGKPSPAAGEKRLVVLPFENLGAPEDEYFADGITDEITARIASIHQLEVIGRSSAIQYKKTNKSPRTIGEELGVSYILSGTVRWQKPPGGTSQVRVTPSLVRVSDATQIWANSYDQTIAEVFQVQSDIALKVAEALHVALLEPERKTLEVKLTDNPEAYEAYLRGMDYYNRGSNNRNNLQLALEMFDKAVRLDPGFVQAYAALARNHAQMYWFRYDHTEERSAKCRAAAEKALELGPDVAEAHLALGIYYYGRLDYERALEQFSFALNKQPRNSEVLEYIAYVKRRQGDLAGSADYLKRALETNPLSANLAYNLAGTYFLMRDYAEAEPLYRRAVSLSPNYINPYVASSSLSFLFISRDGNTTRAREVLEEASKRMVSPDDQNAVHYLGCLVDIFDGDFTGALRHVGAMPLEALDSQFRFIPKSQLYAQIYGLTRDKEKERQEYESARTYLEERIKAQPDDAGFWSALGIAEAGLGHREEAVQAATRATELLPVSREFWRGTCRLIDLAQVYVMVGEYDKALDRIDYLLSVPGELSFSLLQLDPVWAPLRGLPRFQKLSEKYKPH